MSTLLLLLRSARASVPAARPVLVAFGAALFFGGALFHGLQEFIGEGVAGRRCCRRARCFGECRRDAFLLRNADGFPALGAQGAAVGGFKGAEFPFFHAAKGAILPRKVAALALLAACQFPDILALRLRALRVLLLDAAFFEGFKSGDFGEERGESLALLRAAFLGGGLVPVALNGKQGVPFGAVALLESGLDLVEGGAAGALRLIEAGAFGGDRA